ncbi:hypothetical protein GS597_00265 [Synechococcales cyanobacterium C]|uniref:Uncharacterized protein n=1 Tax=Petrachloros mirabilis ULC683 TaxID=2781853 RepID=A0A8K2ABQ8_9CYAN|nr:hypothetical protein [Petrachloros mirabilis]NCJ04979.1 hypothetical protein [Petrachloros mirabilis ULC683]
MSPLLSAQSSSSASDTIWPSLKRAIAASPGFHRWVLERGLDANAKDPVLEGLIRAYLRQTLDTLAY